MLLAYPLSSELGNLEIIIFIKLTGCQIEDKIKINTPNKPFKNLRLYLRNFLLVEVASIGQENMTQILKMLHSNAFSVNVKKKQKRRCYKFVCPYDTHDFYLDI